MTTLSSTRQRFTNATAPNVNFNSGSFVFLANSSTAVSAETLGTVTLASGQSTINAGYAAAPIAGYGGSTLTINTLARRRRRHCQLHRRHGQRLALGVTTNSVLNKLVVNSGLTATNGTAGTFSANGFQYFGNGNNGTTTPTGVGNIIPFAESNGGTAADYASYIANGITAYANTAAGTGAVQTFAASLPLVVNTANDIIKIVGPSSAVAVTVTIPSNTTIGALLINLPVAAANNLSVTWATGSNLTIAGGSYVATGTDTTHNILFGVAATNNTLTLPSASGSFTGETFIFQDKGGTSNRFDPTVVGSGSLVTNGVGSVIFDTTFAGTNYSGGITVNSGTTSTITTTASYGIGPITLTGGTFSPNAITATLVNAVNLNGNVTITAGAANSAYIFAGPVTLTANATLTASNGGVAAPNVATFNGAIGESGRARYLDRAVRGGQRLHADLEQCQHL